MRNPLTVRIESLFGSLLLLVVAISAGFFVYSRLLDVESEDVMLSSESSTLEFNLMQAGARSDQLREALGQ